jgi:hypothetical protein
MPINGARRRRKRRRRRKKRWKCKKTWSKQNRVCHVIQSGARKCQLTAWVNLTINSMIPPPETTSPSKFFLFS